MIAISLLDTDILRLAEKTDAALMAGIDFIHQNFKDYDFFPGGIVPTFCDALRQHGVRCPIEIPLPKHTPLHVVDTISSALNGWILIEPDIQDLNKAVLLVKSNGCKAGLVVNQNVYLEKYNGFLSEVDYLTAQFSKEEANDSGIFESLLEVVENASTLVRKYNNNIQLAASVDIDTEDVKALSVAGSEMFILGKQALHQDDYYTAIASISNQISQAQSYNHAPRHYNLL